MNPFDKKILELDRILNELKSRKKERGMDFYVPNRIQHLAHKSKAKVIVIVKGNRMGGSTWGAMEIAYHVTKKYPDWFPESRRFKSGQALKIRIITDKFAKIDNVIEPKLKTYLPKDEIVRVRRSPQGYITKLHTKDGTMIEFLTIEQDIMAFEGQDLDLFWGDEPVERTRYVATQRGLVDRAGFTILTFTPLIEPWMKEEIVDKADGKDIEVFYGTTRDNRFDIEGSPILHEEDIQRFESLLTEEERETRIEGKFFHLKGIVYKELCDVHLVADFKYEPSYPVICVLDPHDRQPHWLIWAMIDRINDIYVMYESVKHCSLKELAAHILATEKYFGWCMVKRLIDPNFGRAPSRPGSNVTVLKELANYKATFTEANDDKTTGRLKVKNCLHYDRNRDIDLNNKPKLYFVKDKCPKTVRSMRNLQYDEWRMSGDRDPKEEIKQKNVHGAHCVRYLLMSNPAFYLPEIYEPQVAEAYY